MGKLPRILTVGVLLAFLGLHAAPEAFAGKSEEDKAAARAEQKAKKEAKIKGKTAGKKGASKSSLDSEFGTGVQKTDVNFKSSVFEKSKAKKKKKK